MIIAIRDDDTCFFTKPEQLSSVYNDYWHICPVTLSVIPFADAQHESRPPVVLVPPEYQGNAKEYPIGQNEELLVHLRYLLSEGRIGISLHGYSHKRENGKPEFVSGQILHKKAIEGKEYLEKLFNHKITIFTPPNNSLSRAGAKAVINAGMNIVMAYGFYPWERAMNYQNLKCFVILLGHYLKYKKRYPYPGILDCGTHKEHACVALGRKSTSKQLKDSFHFLKDNGANMCIATHYTALYFIPEIRKIFCDFMDYVLSKYDKEVQFATTDKLFEMD
jgi:predicted deacetylase